MDTMTIANYSNVGVRMSCDAFAGGLEVRPHQHDRVSADSAIAHALRVSACLCASRRLRSVLTRTGYLNFIHAGSENASN